MKGYKVTNPDSTCRGHLFEVDKEYKVKGELSICNNGFHFCEKATSCFEYYSFDPKNRVFEVEALGKTQTEGDKTATDHIKIIRELTWLETITIVNSGVANTGRNNSGDSNSGYRNSGNRNSGNWNSGNWNSGNRNSGDSNSGYRNGGAFCTETNPMLRLFDKETNITIKEWEQSEACQTLSELLVPNIWIYSSNMSEEEKKKHPKHEVTDGYLKTISMHEAWSNMWHNLSEERRNVFLTLPNFDKDKFKVITGIEV